LEIEQKYNPITRRTFLMRASKTLGSLIFSSGCLCAAAGQNQQQQIDDFELYDFVMPRVKFVPHRRKGSGQGPDTWNVRPGGDANLLRYLSSVIRCRTKPITGANNWQPQYAADGQFNDVVTFDSLEKIRKYPFLFMTGENYFLFSDNQKDNLKEYIMRGGFLLMDDCVVGNGGDFFYQSAFEMLEDTFGKGAIKRIPNEHEIFHNVYDLGDSGLPSLNYVHRRRSGGLPYMHGQNHGARGVFIGERLAVFLSSTDIHCGWCDSLGIEWGKENYEKAIQMGINIIMYAMSH
jgi:hypothetical protein